MSQGHMTSASPRSQVVSSAWQTVKIWHQSWKNHLMSDVLWYHGNCHEKNKHHNIIELGCHAAKRSMANTSSLLAILFGLHPQANLLLMGIHRLLSRVCTSKASFLGVPQLWISEGHQCRYMFLLVPKSACQQKRSMQSSGNQPTPKSSIFWLPFLCHQPDRSRALGRGECSHSNPTRWRSDWAPTSDSPSARSSKTRPVELPGSWRLTDVLTFRKLKFWKKNDGLSSHWIIVTVWQDVKCHNVGTMATSLRIVVNHPLLPPWRQWLHPLVDLRPTPTTRKRWWFRTNSPGDVTKSEGHWS